MLVNRVKIHCLNSLLYKLSVTCQHTNTAYGDSCRTFSNLVCSGITKSSTTWVHKQRNIISDTPNPLFNVSSDNFLTVTNTYSEYLWYCTISTTHPVVPFDIPFECGDFQQTTLRASGF